MGGLLVILCLIAGVYCDLVSVERNVPYPPTYTGPVIGVLAQTTFGKMEKYGHSYIAASYVKYLEMSGKALVGLYQYLELVFRQLDRFNNSQVALSPASINFHLDRK